MADAEFDDEMKRWASQFGSDRLRMGLEDGYRMNGVYLAERSSSEGFENFYAFKPDAFKRWEGRHGPTIEALLLRRQLRESLRETGLDVEIVWLKKAPEGMLYRGQEWFAEDECEAIVISFWLNRYALITTVNSDDVPVPECVNDLYVAGAL